MSALNSVRFSCTALNNTTKQGILPVDADGYYETVLGGLNVFNSAGEYYTAEGAKELFESSGLLAKRIAKGRLRGEWGHPKQMPGESTNDFLRRVFLINEDRICVHFKEIYLDADRVKLDNGQSVIAIIGKIKPSGPFADSLERSLKNKNENVNFSIRAFTDDTRVRGIVHRVLKTIVTWDYVADPGIAIAEKWKSPSLESHHITEDLESKLVMRGDIEASLKATPLGLAQESAKMNVNELFASMGWSTHVRAGDTARPLFSNW